MADVLVSPPVAGAAGVAAASINRYLLTKIKIHSSRRHSSFDGCDGRVYIRRAND